jgi:hypothetical protein
MHTLASIRLRAHQQTRTQTYVQRTLEALVREGTKASARTDWDGMMAIGLGDWGEYTTMLLLLTPGSLASVTNANRDEPNRSTTRRFAYT